MNIPHEPERGYWELLNNGSIPSPNFGPCLLEAFGNSTSVRRVRPGVAAEGMRSPGFGEAHHWTSFLPEPVAPHGMLLLRFWDQSYRISSHHQLTANRTYSKLGWDCRKVWMSGWEYLFERSSDNACWEPYMLFEAVKLCWVPDAQTWSINSKWAISWMSSMIAMLEVRGDFRVSNNLAWQNNWGIEIVLQAATAARATHTMSQKCGLWLQCKFVLSNLRDLYKIPHERRRFDASGQVDGR